MSLIPHGICILFGQGNPFQGINDLFKGLEELAMAIAAAIIIVLIILVVVLIVAGVGLGAITGMVFKKAASDELDDAETGSTTVTSQVRGCLILLAGPVFGVGALLFSFSAFLAAENRGFDEDWLPVVMILGVVVGIVFVGWYQRRRIRQLGAEKSNGILFLFGLLVSSVFIAVMGSVSVTSLIYIAWQRVGGFGFSIGLFCAWILLVFLILKKISRKRKSHHAVLKRLVQRQCCILRYC